MNISKTYYKTITFILVANFDWVLVRMKTAIKQYRIDVITASIGACIRFYCLRNTHEVCEIIGTMPGERSGAEPTQTINMANRG